MLPGFPATATGACANVELMELNKQTMNNLSFMLLIVLMML